MHLSVSVIDGDNTISPTKSPTHERIHVSVHSAVYGQSFGSFLVRIPFMCLALFLPLLTYEFKG